MPADIDDLLAQLTIEEKVSLLAGTDVWHLPAIERIGLARLKMSDGPNGARGERWFGGPPSACFPCGTALAATWDTALVERVGEALGDEARSKGAHVLLAPTVNLHRSPLGGRDFECYSEDPYLSARMAVSYITGLQRRGVAACVKHFVANDQEFERFTISSDVDERTLRELYLVPFEAAMNEAGAWAAMSAYNKLNGTYCGEHPLLTELLRDEWGWDGVVVSDWWGCHSGAGSLAAGLDIEMPGPPVHRGEKLLAGGVDEALVDRAVGRILLLAERTGALGGPAAEPEPERYDDDAARTQLIHDTSAAGMVLLKNEGGVLPLDPSQSVAVIGPNATRLHAEGGGSAHVRAPHIVTPLAGIQAVFPDVVHQPGCPPATRMARLDPAEIRVETPDETFTTDRSMFVWLGEEAPQSARITTTYRASVSGEHTFRVRGRGETTIRVDGEEVTGTALLSAGTQYAIALDYTPPETNDGRIMLDLRLRQPDDPGMLDRAVVAAREAHTAIVVVGFDDDTETEGRDRPSFDLPAEQRVLIRSVAEANPRTVVVINAASPVAMDWADDANVAAILQIWCPGQEGGRALADVLAGNINPSGRLPTTIPFRIEDTPGFLTWPGESGHAIYGEGVFIGYRAYERRHLEPRYPFGHGLSYTTFAYENLQAPQGELVAGEPVPIGITVTNTGERAGAEVVQVYIRDVEASVARPPKELKAFAKPYLEPGQRATIPFLLEPRAFQYWDTSAHRWKAEPGEFEILVGSSSADIRARTTLTLTAPSTTL